MTTLQSVWAIGAGGAAGALLRYGISSGVKRVVPEDWLWTATMSVNLLGCLLIGVLLVLNARRLLLPPVMFQFAIVGLLGSLTTFSTFAAEVLELLREGRTGHAALHTGINLIIGVACVWLGAAVTTALLPAGSDAV